MKTPEEIRNEIVLDKTCCACPAQWDAYYSGEIVGYIRFRYGRMTVECPNVGGELVYSMQSEDGMQGAFYSATEEKVFLSKALNAITEWIISDRLLPEPAEGRGNKRVRIANHGIKNEHGNAD